MPTGAGLRPGAKAPEEPPDPTGGAPALDPTDERRLETEPRRGVRHRHRRKPPGTATPSAYRHRASRRLYPPPANNPSSGTTFVIAETSAPAHDGSAPRRASEGRILRGQPGRRRLPRRQRRARRLRVGAKAWRGRVFPDTAAWRRPARPARRSSGLPPRRSSTARRSSSRRTAAATPGRGHRGMSHDATSRPWCSGKIPSPSRRVRRVRDGACAWDGATSSRTGRRRPRPARRRVVHGVRVTEGAGAELQAATALKAAARS